MNKRDFRRKTAIHGHHYHSNYPFSTFLFPKSSALTGAGSILNIGGNYYDFNYSASEAEADQRAFAKDWGAVYHDLNTSFGRLVNK